MPTGALTKRSVASEPASREAPSDQTVLETLYHMAPQEAEVWARFAKLAREGGNHPSKAQQDAMVRYLRRKSLVPLDGTVDLPPHVVGRVSERGSDGSVIHNFDLENLVEFPEIFPCLLSGAPSDARSVKIFHAFVDGSLDDRYPRRFIVSHPDLGRKTADLLHQLLQQDPECTNTHLLLLEWYHSQGMWPAATDEARRFRAATVASYELASLDLSAVLSMQGRTEEALKALEPERDRAYSTDFTKRVPYFRDFFRATAIQSVEDAAVLFENLYDFFHTLLRWMQESMPGAFEEAVEQYGDLVGSAFPTGSTKEIMSDPKSLSALLYISFAFRSKTWPDTPAEVFAHFASGTYSVMQTIDRAIHETRRGLFRLTRQVGESEARVLAHVEDLLTGDILKAYLLGPSQAPALAEGAVFRAQLVPWEGLWVPRSPVELVPGPEPGESPLAPFRVWFADTHSPQKDAWVCLVEDADSRLLTTADAAAYLNAGIVVDTLAKTHKERGYLPDILITRAGFPFTDPTGRTSASWRVPRVAESLQGFQSPPPNLRSVSLLQPWVETWGVRHLADTKAIDEVMAPLWSKLSEFIERGKPPSPTGSSRGHDLPSRPLP